MQYKNFFQYKKYAISLCLLAFVTACGGGGGDGDGDGDDGATAKDIPNSSATSIVPLTCKLEKEPTAVLGIKIGKIKVESGSKGSVSYDCKKLQFLLDKPSLNVADLKRETTMDISCKENGKTTTATVVWNSDYKTGISTWSWKKGKGAGLKCTEKYDSPLETTISTSETMENLFLEWGSEDYASNTDLISSDCPKDGVEGDIQGKLECAVNMHQNYSITDDKKAVHKLAIRMGTGFSGNAGGSSSGGSSSGGSSSGGSSSGGITGGSGTVDLSSVGLSGSGAVNDLKLAKFSPKTNTTEIITVAGKSTTLLWVQKTSTVRYELKVAILEIGGVTSKIISFDVFNAAEEKTYQWIMPPTADIVISNDKVVFNKATVTAGFNFSMPGASVGELIIDGTLNRDNTKK